MMRNIIVFIYIYIYKIHYNKINYMCFNIELTKKNKGK